MNILEFSSLVWLGSLLAGFLGASTGLGGGVVIVPLLVLGFGVDIRYAMGASLVSVIATSSAAASAYVKEGFSNIRVGMFLEIATTIGAVAGAAPSRPAYTRRRSPSSSDSCCYTRHTNPASLTGGTRLLPVPISSRRVSG